MKGGVRKRGKSWAYYYEAGRTADGKRKRREKSGFRTKAEAEAALFEAQTLGDKDPTARRNMEEALHEWTSYLKARIKYNTLMNRIGIINNHLVPQFGDMYCDELTPKMVQEYIDSLKVKGLSKSTVKGIFTTLQSFYGWAIDIAEYSKTDPCRRVRLPKFQETNMSHYYIPPEGMELVIDRFRDSPAWLPGLYLGYCCGLRISECFGLTWDNVTLCDGYGYVNIKSQSLYRRPAGEGPEKPGWKSNILYLQSLKTESSVRRVRFGKTVYDVLVNEKKRQEEIRKRPSCPRFYLVDEKDEKGDPIQRVVKVQPGLQVSTGLEEVRFVNLKDSGDLLTANSFKYLCRVVQAELCPRYPDLLPGFNYHSLRKSCSTILIESGVDPKTVSRILGHSSVNMTLDKYMALTEKLEKEAADIMGSRLSGADMP